MSDETKICKGCGHLYDWFGTNREGSWFCDAECADDWYEKHGKDRANDRRGAIDAAIEAMRNG